MVAVGLGVAVRVGVGVGVCVGLGDGVRVGRRRVGVAVGRRGVGVRRGTPRLGVEVVRRVGVIFGCLVGLGRCVVVGIRVLTVDAMGVTLGAGSVCVELGCGVRVGSGPTGLCFPLSTNTSTTIAATSRAAVASRARLRRMPRAPANADFIVLWSWVSRLLTDMMPGVAGPNLVRVAPVQLLRRVMRRQQCDTAPSARSLAARKYATALSARAGNRSYCLRKGAKPGLAPSRSSTGRYMLVPSVASVQPCPFLQSAYSPCEASVYSPSNSIGIDEPPRH